MAIVFSKNFPIKQSQTEKAELDSVLDAIVKHTKANIDYQKLGMNIFELSQLGRDIYEKKALMEEKRELLNFVFSNLKIKDGKVAPTLQNGFELVAARAQGGDWLRDLDSNQDTGIQSPMSYH